jgi:hypothetical protein
MPSAFLALVVAASVLTSVELANAGSPCWQTVINDWADNARVDGRYPIHCYRDALRNLPEDMRAYSSAPDDIERAMRDEIRRLQEESSGSDSGDSGAVTTDAVGTQASSEPPGTSKPQGSKRDKGRAEAPPAYLAEPDPDDERESDGLFVQALDEVGPKDASSFPLPVLALAVLMGVLLIAGGVAHLIRRNRPRPTGGIDVHKSR